MQKIDYTIYSDKVKKDIYADLKSDLHYIPGDDLSYLKKSIDKMELEKPDYSFFLGDLINDSKYTVQELRELIELVARMAKLTKVIMVLGNHDQFTKNSDGKWEEKYNQEFVDALKNAGINVLQNEKYEDEFISVYGTQFPGIYYEEREPVMDFAKNISQIEYSNPELFKILAEHSPSKTFDGEFMSLFGNLKNVDLTLAGHFHNGCVPWYISKFIKGNKGLVDPYMNFFPDNARESKEISETNYGIVSVPLTTFTSESKFSLINKVFYPSVEQNILIKKR